MLRNASGVGVGNQNMSLGQNSHAVGFQSSISSGPEGKNGQLVNMPANLGSVAAFQQLTMGLSSMPQDVLQASMRGGEDNAADQIKTLLHKAYVSPIMLRRSMRGVSDLKTRIKLQKMLDKRAKGTHGSTTNLVEGKSTSELTGNRPASKVRSSLASAKRRRAAGGTSKLFSDTLPN
jgi:hypothetical protein